MSGKRKLRVAFVEQSVWRAEGSAYLSMPLASGYLKAMILADPDLRDECEVVIHNFSGAEAPPEILYKLLAESSPDIIGFSVLGWNYGSFGEVCRALRNLLPECWIVWGGNHVSDQAERTAREWPCVDVTVNGEGELTVRELVRSRLAGTALADLGGVAGVSVRLEDGSIVTTAGRARIENLDEIPSPLLTGAIDLHGPNGDFLYDYALMETNRGCPYACAFCYWGGAIGQKVRAFSMDRLAEEIELLARREIADIMLCDANFGMLRQDEEFIELCIRAREKYGYPRHIMTSWAKNKGQVFYRIVRRMHETGFHSAFNLALQSLDQPVLDTMGRRNMKINDWEQLAAWLRAEGLDVYGELIWGCPGETIESFLDGYDRLARHVTRIAVYPLLIMPNTDYAAKREELGFVTRRRTEHDFELVVAHKSMSVEENREMHAFLFWARVLAEHLVFRHVFAPLHLLEGITQSQLLLSLDRWLAASDDPLARRITAVRNGVMDELEAGSRAIEEGLQLLFGEPGTTPLLAAWWREDVLPRVAPERRTLFEDVFRYDLLTMPIFKPLLQPGLERGSTNGAPSYRRRGVAFTYDIPALSAAWRRGEDPTIRPTPIQGDIVFRVGFANDMRLYHNVHNLKYFGEFVPYAPEDGASPEPGSGIDHVAPTSRMEVRHA